MTHYQNNALGKLQNYFKKRNKTIEYRAHSSKVHSLGWSCDGRKLASGSFDKCVAIFSLDTDRLLNDVIFRGHNDSVDQLCWHASNPDLLSSASGDRSVRIWDARYQRCAATISTTGENINITWAPDGNTIAVGNKEDVITYIDSRTHKITSEKKFNFEVNEISWNNDSSLFFLTNGQGHIYVLSYPEFEVQTVLKAHPANCLCIDFDPLGRYFAVGSSDSMVSLWDVCELTCVGTFTRLDWPVRSVGFSHDGELLASGSEDHFIDIAQVSTGQKVCDIPVQAGTFTVAWHPKIYLLAYACEDKDQYDINRDTGNVKIYGFPSY